MLTVFGLVLLGFLSGSIMYSYLLPKLFYNKDSRDYGEDRNPGGANAIKAVGPAVGLICILLDVLKAFIPVYFGVRICGTDSAEIVLVACAPVLGHAFSPFLHFKGGKAIAAAYGSMLALSAFTYAVFFMTATMAIFTFVIVVAPDSARIVLSMVLVSLLVLLKGEYFWINIAIIAVSAIVIYKHVTNWDKKPLSISAWKYKLFTWRIFM
ncbi:MAG TPA: glycerol-3-phosphate acyltransferase [Clostridia bacterium]|nr:glycerol-3-phosphate acyltransferase [Clostridia bacterium]